MPSFGMETLQLTTLRYGDLHDGRAIAMSGQQMGRIRAGHPFCAPRCYTSHCRVLRCRTLRCSTLRCSHLLPCQGRHNVEERELCHRDLLHHRDQPRATRVAANGQRPVGLKPRAKTMPMAATCPAGTAAIIPMMKRTPTTVAATPSTHPNRQATIAVARQLKQQRRTPILHFMPICQKALIKVTITAQRNPQASRRYTL